MGRIKIFAVTTSFGITVFLGSFLLFVIQPMVGKLSLPIFGGVSTVWTTVMLFFTIIILSGYGYVVWVTRRSKIQQLRIHILLVVSTLVFLGFNYWKTDALFSVAELPSARGLPIFSLLMMLKNFVLPCFLLATTSTLFQSWFTRSFSKKSPYWLYIISNIGSLIGLLAYPFVVEPYLSLSFQQSLWSWGFFAYCLLVIVISFITFHNSIEVQIEKMRFKLKPKLLWVWFALPFVSTTAMLALTNQLTQNFTPMPFIWVATLGVYLTSFVVAFLGGKWYERKFYGLLMLFLITIISIFTSGFVILKYQFTFFVALAALLTIDLVCHRELFRRRPEPEGLTVYYLMISFGGVVASVFVALIAPQIFPDIWEYPLILEVSAIIGTFIIIRKSRFTFRLHSVIFGLLVVLLVAWLFIYSRSAGRKPSSSVIVTLRNFYGVVSIEKTGDAKPYELTLYSGTTMHGVQTIGGGDENIPKVSYTHESGLGNAILTHPKRLSKQPMRIGVVGLGAGMIASYCRNGDTIRFYEINPQMIQLSRDYFTYLSNAKRAGCKVEIIQGDARISLDNEVDTGQNGNFDILVIDAFNNHSIPIHLLTREAMQTYLAHLANGGLVAFHSLDDYYDLYTELETIAAAERVYFTEAYTSNDRWVFLSRFLYSSQSYIPIQVNNNKNIPWTDDYSNILRSLYR